MSIPDDEASAKHTVDWHFVDGDQRSAANRTYREQLERFQKRRRQAFVVRVATTVVAIGLIALGAALVASSFTSMSNEYLAQRHVPGADGSISIQAAGSYALVQTTGEPLPSCGVVNAADQSAVPLEAWKAPGSPPLDTWRFDAAVGRYEVTCLGGNDGMVAYAAGSVDMLQRGYFGIVLQALPFLLVGLILFFGGKVVARRLAPESLRPLIPS